MGALGHQRCDVENQPEWDGWIGWGTYRDGGAQEVALWVCKPFNGEPATVGNGTMVALQAKSWRQVDAFHARGVGAHGGSSEGAPGAAPTVQPRLLRSLRARSRWQQTRRRMPGRFTPTSGGTSLARAHPGGRTGGHDRRASDCHGPGHGDGGSCSPGRYPSHILERYTGYYALSVSSVITVTRAGSAVDLVQLPGPPAEIYAQTVASFVYKTLDTRIDFMPNPPIEITTHWCCISKGSIVRGSAHRCRRRHRPSRQPMSERARAAPHEFAGRD